MKMTVKDFLSRIETMFGPMINSEVVNMNVATDESVDTGMLIIIAFTVEGGSRNFLTNPFDDMPEVEERREVVM